MFSQKLVLVFVVVGVLIATCVQSVPVGKPVSGEVPVHDVSVSSDSNESSGDHGDHGDHGEVGSKVSKVVHGLEGLVGHAGAEVSAVVKHLLELLEKELGVVEGSGSGVEV